MCHIKEQSGFVSQLAENSGQRQDGDEKTLTYLFSLFKKTLTQLNELCITYIYTIWHFWKVDNDNIRKLLTRQNTQTKDTF